MPTLRGLGRAAAATALAASAMGACASAAHAQDSEAPAGALPHYLPPERWVYQHWLPFDEDRLYDVLATDRGAIWRHLRDDAAHDLAQLARRRGMTPRQAALRLVAPRRAHVSARRFAQLVSRAQRTLTQGHLSQHILFHSLHQLAIPDRARWIFGTRSVEEYLRLRRAELSPQQIGRLHGRTQAQMLRRSVAALRTEARKGVRTRATSARQARLLLDRQLRQVPRFLGQSRYNGPPRTTAPSTPELPPNDFANGPTITADGGTVVFDAYRATIPEAKALGEIRVQRFDVATGTRADVTPPVAGRAPRSAYNAQVAAGGGAVVYEEAAGNRNFAKRYGAMHVLARVLGTGRTTDLSHARVRGSRTAYNPSISADGHVVAFEASDDGGRGGRSRNVLEVHDRRTGAVHRLGEGAGYDAVYEPRLTGDGRSIVFTAADGRSAVHLRDLVTGASTRIATDAREPAAAHDGSVVAYTTGTGRRSVVAALDRRTGERRRLTTTALGQALDTAISPDGRFVAFTLRRGARSRVHLVDRTTGQATAVSPAGPGVASEPAVSADGTRVAYTTTAALPGKPLGTPGVVLADLAAGTRTLISAHEPIKAGPGARGAARRGGARSAVGAPPGRARAASSSGRHAATPADAEAFVCVLAA